MKTLFAIGLALVIFAAGVSTIERVSRRPANDESGGHAVRSGALEALNFWTRARAYPANDIPPEKFTEAFRHARTAMKKLARDPASTNQWQSIGPLNLSGRTLSVAVNPQNSNTLFAGSASGGLWRSYSDGLNSDWERIRTGFPVLGVGAIAIQPNDSNVIYIGTGEVYQYDAALGGLIIRTTRGSYGIGILKSTDAGRTWMKSLDWSMNSRTGVQCITFNPMNYNTLLAATSEGIFKSTDAGANWYQTLNAPMAENILVNPQDTGLAIASVGNFSSFLSGIYYTFDTGENWIGSSGLVTGSGKTMLEMYGKSPNVLYASVAETTTSVSALWRSTDFGFTWVLLNGTDVAGVQGWYSHYVAVHPLDSTQIVRGGVGIYKSLDGGHTQFSAGGSYSDHHAFAHDPSNPDILYDANDDGVYRSTDFGESFSYVSGGLVTGQFYNGFSNSSQDSLLAIGQVQDHIPGYGYHGSPYWARTAVDECGWTAMNPQDDHFAFAVNRNGGAIYRSGDRANSFSGVFSNAEFGAWNTPIILSPSNPSVIYEGRNLVYKSTNNGATWAATGSAVIGDGNVALAMGISATSADTLYVGKAPATAGNVPRVYRTINGGLTWTDITGALPNAYPLDIAVDPKNSAIVYIGYGSFGNSHLYKSTNAGNTWTGIGNILPDVPVTAIALDPQNSNFVYVGTDIGVYVSTDGGSNWNDFSEGFPDAVLISDLVVSPSNRTLRAVTHGNGVFERAMPPLIPFLTLTAPTGGESWDALTDHQITWDLAAVGMVTIDFSTDNGVHWSVIADSIPASTGKYSWHVPYLASTQAKVRVSAVGTAGLSSQSGSVFSIRFRGAVLQLASGWNMISVPVQPPSSTASTLFPAAVSPLFEYIPGSGYASIAGTASVEYGKGYWVRYQNGTALPIIGDSITTLQIAVSAGWNMLGSISAPVPRAAITTNPPGLLSPSIFRYIGGYQVADTVRPGEGYWVKAAASGTVTLTANGPGMIDAVAGNRPSPDLPQLTLSDAAGHRATLFLGTAGPVSNPDVYELPPVPPRGEFDARFANQSCAAQASKTGRPEEFPILVQGESYPFTITATAGGWSGWKLTADGSSYPLAGHPSIILRARQQRLALSYDPAAALPQQFTLRQNFPNPFNPATTLTLDFPAASRATLIIYNTIGQPVATLLDGAIDAGVKTVSWDASSLPSGVYLARFTAGAFTQTRKMLLLR